MSMSRGGGGGVTPSVEHLRRVADLALRQVKKLRKYELEQVCMVAGLPTAGLKASLLTSIESYLGRQFSQVARSAGGLASHARELAAVAEEISMGYMDVLHKRPVAGTYSHHTSGVKQDGGFGQQVSALAGLPRGGAGGGGSSGGLGGAPRWDAEASKDVRRRAELDPFVEVTETLSGPSRLERGSGSQDVVVLRFNLPHVAMEAVQRSLSADKSTHEGRKSHVLLRAYKLNKNGSSGGPAQDGELGGHLWPLESVCQVNGNFQQLKQRKVFFQGTTRKLKGDCSPQDIGHACRVGENRVELYSSDPDSTAVLVQTVRLVGVDEVLRDIKQRSHLTKKEALRRVKRSFKGCLDLDVAGGSSEDEEEDDDANGDSDDELMATATRLSLRCPLGLVPITCPGRGRFCKHLQCFDLKTFLNFNKDCAGAAWKCGVCNMPLKPADLVVDTYLDEVVRTLEEQGLTNDAEEVEIHKDGHWDPILEDQKAGKSRRERKKMQAASSAAGGAGAGQGIAPLGSSAGVGVLLENGGGGGSGGGNHSDESAVDLGGDEAVGMALFSGDDSGPASAGAGAGAAAAAEPAADAAPEHEVFDLSLDSTDDEEDPPAPIAPPPAPRPPVGSLTAAAAAVAAAAATAAANAAASSPGSPLAPAPPMTANGLGNVTGGGGGSSSHAAVEIESSSNSSICSVGGDVGGGGSVGGGGRDAGGSGAVMQFRNFDVLSGASASEKARHPSPAIGVGSSSSGRQQPLDLSPPPPPSSMDTADNDSAGRASPVASAPGLSVGDGGGGGAFDVGGSAADGGAQLDDWEREILVATMGGRVGEERGRGSSAVAQHGQLGAPQLVWDNPLVAFSTGHPHHSASMMPAGEGTGSGSGGGDGVSAARRQVQGLGHGQGQGQAQQQAAAAAPSSGGGVNSSSNGGGGGGGYGQPHPLSSPPVSPPPPQQQQPTLLSPSALGSGSGSSTSPVSNPAALHPSSMHHCGSGFSPSPLSGGGGQGTAMRGSNNHWEELNNQARLGSAGSRGGGCGGGGSSIVGWESPAMPAGGGAHSLKRPRPGSNSNDYQKQAQQRVRAAASGRVLPACGGGSSNSSSSNNNTSNNNSNGNGNGPSSSSSSSSNNNLQKLPFIGNMFGSHGGSSGGGGGGGGSSSADSSGRRTTTTVDSSSSSGGGGIGLGGGSGIASFWGGSGSSSSRSGGTRSAAANGGGAGSSRPAGGLSNPAGAGATAAVVGSGGAVSGVGGGSVIGWDDEVLRTLDGLGDPIG